MKIKRLIIGGIAVYFILAYTFMWPPMVLYYWNWHKEEGNEAVFCLPSESLARHNYGYETHPCINNLRQIEAAANEFAQEHHLTNGAPINYPNDLKPYIKLNSAGEMPSCPAGGVYSISVVGSDPVCSYVPKPLVKVRTNAFFFYYLYGPWSDIPHRLP